MTFGSSKTWLLALAGAVTGLAAWHWWRARHAEIGDRVIVKGPDGTNTTVTMIVTAVTPSGDVSAALPAQLGMIQASVVVPRDRILKIEPRSYT